MVQELHHIILYQEILKAYCLKRKRKLRAKGKGEIMKIENLLYDIHHKMIKNTEEERRLRNTHDYVNENEETKWKWEPHQI